jgi:hypothetical protein
VGETYQQPKQETLAERRGSSQLLLATRSGFAVMDVGELAPTNEGASDGRILTEGRSDCEVEAPRRETLPDRHARGPA